MTKTILITGAAGGVGSALAARAVARGDQVFAAARKASQIAAAPWAAGAAALEMDMGAPASIEAAFVELDRLLAGRPLDAVIHCAALAPNGPFETTSTEEFAEILNVNVLATHRIMRLSLPRLRGHGGRLILISSLWSVSGGPLLSSYSASKHAMSALCDSMRRETRGQNLHISMMQLGAIRTKMLAGQSSDLARRMEGFSPEMAALYGEKMRHYARLTEKSPATSAEKAAVSIERALNHRRPRPRYRVGFDAKAYHLLGRALPSRWFDVLLGKGMVGS